MPIDFMDLNQCELLDQTALFSFDPESDTLSQPLLGTQVDIVGDFIQYISKSKSTLIERKRRRKAETHKTVPCQAWKDTGRCNYGKRCKFAHGEEELRPTPASDTKLFNNPRYRTALCIKQTFFGFCPYGDQCHFIHNPQAIDLEKCLDKCISDSSSTEPLIQSSSTAPSIQSWSTAPSIQSSSTEPSIQSSDTERSNRSSQRTSISDDPFYTDNAYKEEIVFQPIQFDSLTIPLMNRGIYH